jgi:cellulose synthase/poly-beta-1,6-N-acetylglucosamine synthase-like glycosyltransferase
MIVNWLGSVFLGLTLTGCGIIWIANVVLIFQLISYFGLRPAGLAGERERLAAPLPPEAELPDVVVQIPVFNEGPIVERSIANAMKLDWPKDRLHIQICDDSTDHTTELARAAAAQATAQGFDVAVIHRDDRNGFKAGSLQAAMTATNYQYFTILDVDFISPPDFLRRCMTVLLPDAKLAFVQARPDFSNAGTNILTRAQAMILDYHYGVEQATRSWSGQVLPFNGTCGVWRRTAIELGGGWRGETLTEDWELSFLTRLKGMRGIYVTSVTASGELPASLRVWIPQQKRWTKGMGQVAWTILPRIIGAKALPPEERVSAFYPLIQWFLTAVFTATYLLAIPAILLHPSQALLLGLTVYAGYLANGVVIFAMMLVGSSATHRRVSLPRFLLNYWPVPFLVLYVSWLHFRALPAIVMGREATFVRTPKRGFSALIL